jgi:hypothetical protein
MIQLQIGLQQTRSRLKMQKFVAEHVKIMFQSAVDQSLA